MFNFIFQFQTDLFINITYDQPINMYFVKELFTTVYKVTKLVFLYQLQTLDNTMITSFDHQIFEHISCY